ncbi:[protein-PII] uridylyltransferase [Natronosporangium hydrolyticum]|uniref:Bifunctional uridylyltransferase/uridylyl-removing enzyme n=1 Tax=Natronosporangium hydrolyticum TaxID=2811111 RepID=A0A895Y728_9ACTN|nr:[protein-PII] uridylyltransferase [Natronosporangium hydrolyticum]QSB13544.1 [protein-PII] uridylyltransferase [Natronosporangium hydrolyticum]
MKLDTDQVGAAARDARAAALDRFLAELMPTPVPRGVALVAVGGLGRRECAPHSDLDLLLLHQAAPGIGDLATQLWYPIWDRRYALDHSTRTLAEALAVAQEDLAVALGLLDARHVAGDPALTAELVAAARDQWRRTAASGLPRLRAAVEQRHDRHGELAFLLEGDVKESRGGLRDVGILRSIGYAGVADTMLPPVRAACTRLLDVRDALHLSMGRRVDRLLAQEAAAVAASVGLPDRDALLRRVATDARTVAHALDDGWRSVTRWRESRRRGAPASRPQRRPLARDVVEYDGEAVLARTAIAARPDPTLSLRVAAAAATAGLPIARATCEWLASYCPPLPRPWPAPARDALLTLLGAGPALVATWETCDRYGLVAGWLPEWHRLRSAPQHHPVHLYTLDRHLVQAAAEAARFAREVERPDLLLLGALLHDVGKGLPGDHSEAGAPVAEAIATRIGLPAADVAVLRQLVRLHLLLPETATRRDLSDPVTIRTVADAVADLSTLELLHALARADAAATGPAAWSQWKERLIGDLVASVAAALRDGGLPTPPEPDPALVAGPLPAVHLDGDRVAVAAADRSGLLGSVAGCLAMHRLGVLSADTATVDGRALVEFVVEPRFGQWPDPSRLAVDLRRVAEGDISVTQRLRRGGHRRGGGAPPRVVWHRGAASDAVILELRAADSPGLLFRVASALDEVGAEVRAARISTLGADAVDAFYLTGSWADEGDRKRVETAVLAVA